MVKSVKHPCEKADSACRWWFGGICLCHPDIEKVQKGIATYLPVDRISREECKRWYIPWEASPLDPHHRTPGQFAVKRKPATLSGSARGS